MKKVDLGATSPTLRQMLKLAGEEDLVLETREGRRYMLVEIDDFADEVAAVVKNKALMKLLDERAKETATVPLNDVRERLNGKKKAADKGRRPKRR